MIFFDDPNPDVDITNVTFNDLRRLRPINQAAQQIMQGKSVFSAAERELMAAYVSGLNACTYCHGAHVATAVEYGVSPTVIEGLLQDINTAPVDEKLKPIFAYLKKLTLSSSQLTAADVSAVTDAGWSREDLHDAILVGCLFSFFNRLVDGHGLRGNKYVYQLGAEHLHKRGYGMPWFFGMIKGFIQKARHKKIQVWRSGEGARL